MALKRLYEFENVLNFFYFINFPELCLWNSKFKKDQSIDAATRQELKTLNDKLFEEVTKDSLAIVQSLMSPAYWKNLGTI